MCGKNHAMQRSSEVDQELRPVERKAIVGNPCAALQERALTSVDFEADDSIDRASASPEAPLQHDPSVSNFATEPLPDNDAESHDREAPSSTEGIQQTAHPPGSAATGSRNAASRDTDNDRPTSSGSEPRPLPRKRITGAILPNIVPRPRDAAVCWHPHVTAVWSLQHD